MSRRSEDDELLATVTHARLRAGQGDVDGARRILERRLAADPADADARRLLETLGAPPAPPPAPETGVEVEAAASEPVAGPEAPLDRTERLKGWLRGSREDSTMEQTATHGAGLDACLEQVQDLVEGVRAVFLVGMDGMIAAGSSRSEAGTWEFTVASYIEIVRKTVAAHREGELAGPTELVVSTSDAHFIFRALTDEYALFTILDTRSGSLGRARFEMRKAANQILPELML
ncbi:hypothetical protein ABI59_01320 [Acidobacteria bacterium Mor1]|nr:hypothetical protein ABI59_01320 [Acidobacteria bacterium Mor1]